VLDNFEEFMPQFTDFIKTHGPAAKCRPATESSIVTYREKLPEPLIAQWEDSGWCAYGGGLIWLADPDQLKATVMEWLGAESNAIPFARSAFGHIFLWDQECAHMLDPQYGTIGKFVNKIEVVFNYVLRSKQYLDDVLDIKLFRKASKKLGQLEYDECYGFEPAIALGGPGTLDTLRKVKLLEHLSILAQLVDEVRRV
jgi:hypothetical protein